MASGSRAYTPTFGSLPNSVQAYRKIGPFDKASLPKALTAAHRLKEGTYGLLTLKEGQVQFIWDEQEHETANKVLQEGESIVIPPQVWHHLEIADQFKLEIQFLH